MCGKIKFYCCSCLIHVVIVDFDKIAEEVGEIKSVKNRRTYGNKDILELQYYKNYNIMKRHFISAIIFMVLWIPLLVSEIRYLLRK
mgnify:FL=1